jgi:hypothetical protein
MRAHRARQFLQIRIVDGQDLAADRAFAAFPVGNQLHDKGSPAFAGTMPDAGGSLKRVKRHGPLQVA